MGSVEKIPVFRNGKWIHYPVPQPLDPMWSSGNLLQAASFYANALSRGYNHDESAEFAKAYVYKKIYSGLSYSGSLELKICTIANPVETT